MSNKVIIPSKKDINESPWSFYQALPDNQTLNIKSLENETSLYMYNYNTREEIELKLIPDTLAASYTSRIAKQTPFGVVHPINYYTGGSAKAMSFTLDLHEDLHNVDGSIYTLIDKIKMLSEPFNSNGKLKEPLIYFQLGHQFAGKGHVSTSITMNTPYRRGRFIYVNIGFNFTYHEDFQVEQIDILDNVYSTSHSGVVAGVFDTYYSEDYDNYEDFFKDTFDYEYVMTQLFADAKINRYLNTALVKSNPAYQSQITSAMAGDLESYLSALEATNQTAGTTIDSIFGIYGITTMLLELAMIIKPEYDYNTILTNLDILNRKVENAMSTFKNMEKRGDSYYDYSGPTVSYISEYNWISAIGALESIQSIITKQASAYSALRGYAS